MMEEFQVTVGIIVRPHGLRGMVKAMPTTDDPGRFQQLHQVGLHLQGRALGEFQLERVEIIKQKYLLLKFRQYDTLAAVEPLRGAEIRIPRSQALPTGENQYYHFDIIGLPVRTTGGRELGRVVDIISYPAHDVWVVQDEQQHEWLIPALASVIQEVNLQQRLVVITPIAGLLEDFSASDTE